MSERGAVFVTGATGLVGGEVLARLLESDPSLRAFALVRDGARWAQTAARLGEAGRRVTPVSGDLLLPSLGIERGLREALARQVNLVVHAAADVVFSRPLDLARATNTEGTRRVLEAAQEWPRVERLAYVSTAFVAGRKTGYVAEDDNGADAGWVNGYEQSKYEAERLVRGSSLPWIILRPSAIVCDSAAGSVTQFNAAHHAMKLFYLSLAPMLPGTATTPVDFVPCDFVARATASLARRADLAGRTVHLCAGRGALTLGEILDLAWEVWSSEPAWRRKAIPRPALVELGTYRLFEQTVEETADECLRRATRSLSWFVPQLALPKRYDTAAADAEFGRPETPARDLWIAMLDYLTRTRWGGALLEIAA